MAILLGGDAGLRRGEIVALHRIDVDLRRRQLKVEVNDWTGIVDTPKSGRGRVVALTEALFEALTKNRHLRGDRVLTLDDGSPVPGHTLRDWVERARRRAGLEATGNVHILRHTFCSHLAMRGAAPKAIQDLAGHQHLSTTMPTRTCCRASASGPSAQSTGGEVTTQWRHMTEPRAHPLKVKSFGNSVELTRIEPSARCFRNLNAKRDLALHWLGNTGEYRSRSAPPDATQFRPFPPAHGTIAAHGK